MEYPTDQTQSCSSHSPSSSSAYQALLRAGPRLKPLQQVHAHLIVTGAHRSRSLLTKLAALACTAKSIAYTRKLSLFIPNPDSYLFNTLIRISSKVGSQYDAVFFFRRMILSPTPLSNYTFTSVIKACADVSALRLGQCVHSLAVVDGFGLDTFVQSSLVSLYAKCGQLRVARKVFDKMPQRSVISWNAMISGYEQNGHAKEGVDLFNLMVVSSGIEPDSTTFVSVLTACAQLGSLELGSWVHNHVVDHGLEVNVILGTALINMYARCGNVRKAREVFNGIKDKNVVAWTAMISGYGIHGYGKEAVELYHLMKDYGILPNDVTFVSLLSACGHAGMVNEGRQIYKSMKTDYCLVPSTEHRVCMVDLLGRAGLLNEAFDYTLELKKPSPAVWTAMLGACKIHKNFDLGIRAADNLLALEPENPGHYVILSNLYALGGQMGRVETVRNMMIKRRLRKHVGYSIIEIDQKTRLFSMGDKSHPETSEIYGYLDDLMSRINEAGYVAAQESVLHELEEEEREYALRYHSEKLAVAFGLLRARQGSSVRVVKNLRMCQDCHLVIKFFSRVTNTEIIVRDKLRFHHFKDGICSCADYW